PSIMDRLIGKAAAIHDLVYLIKRNLRRLLCLVWRLDGSGRHCRVLDHGGGEAIPGANIVEEEIAIWVKGLRSECIGDGEFASVHLGPGLGRRKRGQVAGGAPDAGKELRSSLRRVGCRESLVPWRGFRSTHK